MTNDNRQTIINEYDALLSPEEENALNKELINFLMPLITKLQELGYIEENEINQNSIDNMIFPLYTSLAEAKLKGVDEEALNNIGDSAFVRFIATNKKDKPINAQQLFEATQECI